MLIPAHLDEPPWWLQQSPYVIFHPTHVCFDLVRKNRLVRDLVFVVQDDSFQPEGWVDLRVTLTRLMTGESIDLGMYSAPPGPPTTLIFSVPVGWGNLVDTAICWDFSCECSEVIIWSLCSLPCFPCDFNGDDLVNSQDLFDFLAEYWSNGIRADFNGNGVVNSQDFFDFIAAMPQGV